MQTKTETKHTPGPWAVLDNTATPYGQLMVESENDGAVALCYTVERGENAAPWECVANARLIAAAPDLFKALREIVAAVEAGEADGYSPSGDWFREAKAAINKATG